MVCPSDYDHVIVAFSAGKDSTACFLHLLEIGTPLAKIELWHHEIDGHEGSTLMDWPSTPAYCRRFAEAFHVPMYFSWREGGFEREMLRNETATGPVHWQNPDGTIGSAGGKGPPGTRLKFPQVSADLSVRWCSAYLKVDVCAAAIRNQPRFIGKKVLLLSGERAEESPCRARYKEFENDRSNSLKRSVHRWRPIHGWTEHEVWDIMARYKINPHPAYRLGWSRLSCRGCIFGMADQWAALRSVDPSGFDKISAYEKQFGKTIQRKNSIIELAEKGKPYAECIDCETVAEAMNKQWSGPIIISEWKQPAGAYRHSGGPI